MTYLDFVREFDKGTIHHAYLFTGTEDYLIDTGLKRLTDKLVDPATKEFNHDIFYASQVDAGKIIDAASAYPMLADTRVVVVKELHKLSPSDMEVLSGYVAKQPATTRFIFITEKFNARGKVQATFKSHTCFVECKPLYDNQIPDWIKHYAKENNCDISHKACLLIQSYVGNNLRAIVNEIEKLRLNVTGSKIEEEHIQKVVGLSRKFSVFNLNDALGNRELDKSLLILNKMLESGESAVAILAMISRHFQNLVKVKGAAAHGKSQGEIAAIAGIPPFFVQKTGAMANNFSFEQLEQAFSLLLETDLQLKTSQQPPQIALQMLLLKILKP